MSDNVITGGLNNLTVTNVKVVEIIDSFDSSLIERLSIGVLEEYFCKVDKPIRYIKINCVSYKQKPHVKRYSRSSSFEFKPQRFRVNMQVKTEKTRKKGFGDLGGNSLRLGKAGRRENKREVR